MGLCYPILAKHGAGICTPTFARKSFSHVNIPAPWFAYGNIVHLGHVSWKKHHVHTFFEKHTTQSQFETWTFAIPENGFVQRSS
jgi:hypothetical protein